MRLLTLSVNDPVSYLQGRRMQPKPSGPRWVDAYHTPGQVVTLQLGSCSLKAAIATAPIEARADSANLDACIVELAVPSNHGMQPLATADPGAVAEISTVTGMGFASPTNAQCSLTKVLEEKRPMVIAASGVQGIAAARAALQWEPLQAHATERPVVLIYMADSPQCACFMWEWDAWQQAGLEVLPVYRSGSEDFERLPEAGNGESSSEDATLLPEADRCVRPKQF